MCMARLTVPNGLVTPHRRNLLAGGREQVRRLHPTELRHRDLVRELHCAKRRTRNSCVILRAAPFSAPASPHPSLTPTWRMTPELPSGESNKADVAGSKVKLHSRNGWN